MVVVNVCGIDKGDYLIHVFDGAYALFYEQGTIYPCTYFGGIPHNPADTWRNDKVVDTSKPRRFDVMMMLLLHCVGWEQSGHKNVMAFSTTDNPSVCSTVCSDQQQRNIKATHLRALCEGTSLVNPPQSTGNAESAYVW